MVISRGWQFLSRVCLWTWQAQSRPRPCHRASERTLVCWTDRRRPPKPVEPGLRQSSDPRSDPEPNHNAVRPQRDTAPTRILALGLQSLGRAQRRQGIATPDFQIRFPEEHIGDRPRLADLRRALGCPARSILEHLRPRPTATWSRRRLLMPHKSVVAETIPSLRVGVRVASVVSPAHNGFVPQQSLHASRRSSRAKQSVMPAS